MNAGDSHLERVKDLQEAFKPGVGRVVAVRIMERAIEAGEVWPDQVHFDDIPQADHNCVGSAWRKLKNVGLIAHTASFRRSEAEGAKGRTIFKWVLVDATLARVFLRRNRPEPVRPPVQEEMAL